MKHIKIFEAFSNDEYNAMLDRMSIFGLSKENIINGYVKMYHGGKILPKKIINDQIFFMTPDKDIAKNYAKMRNGKVFSFMVKPEDVDWNTGSLEVEFNGAGTIVKGVLKKDSTINTDGYNESDPWNSIDDFRNIIAYKNVKVGDKLPKSGSVVEEIIQYQNAPTQFVIGGKFIHADSTIRYEFA